MNKVTSYLNSISNTIKVCSGGSRISRRGGRGPRRGGMDSQGGYDSKILYVKTKESGPLGGGGRAPGICLCRSANGMSQMTQIRLSKL